ncbi:unnamed protein product [Merluccius merluccius]
MLDAGGMREQSAVARHQAEGEAEAEEERPGGLQADQPVAQARPAGLPECSHDTPLCTAVCVDAIAVAVIAVTLWRVSSSASWSPGDSRDVAEEEEDGEEEKEEEDEEEDEDEGLNWAGPLKAPRDAERELTTAHVKDTQNNSSRSSLIWTMPCVAACLTRRFASSLHTEQSLSVQTGHRMEDYWPDSRPGETADHTLRESGALRPCLRGHGRGERSRSPEMWKEADTSLTHTAVLWPGQDVRCCRKTISGR